MHSDSINARLSAPLAKFVSEMVGDNGLYETPSEYVRDLIRRDMERRHFEAQNAFEAAVLEGYSDAASGRIIVSSGDFKTDMALFERCEEKGWEP